MLIAGYVLSLLMGLSLGLIGGGGSILIVPILVYFFRVDPLVATTESLFIVGSTALIGSFASYLNKEVNLKIVVKFATFSFAGVFVMKKLILTHLPNVLFTFLNFEVTKSLLTMIIFAILMLTVSLSMIFLKIPQQKVANNTFFKTAKMGLQGFFVGSVTGLVGAGGGFLIVPALVNLLKLNMRAAIGSSLLIIAANSLFGFGVSLSDGFKPHWQMLLSILFISVVGLFIGRNFSQRIPEAKLKKGFGYFLLAMGSVIIIDQVFKLFAS